MVKWYSEYRCHSYIAWMKDVMWLDLTLLNLQFCISFIFCLLISCYKLKWIHNVWRFFEFLPFCFQDLEDQPLTAIVSYIIFCLEISHKMSNHIYSTKRLSKKLMLCFYIWFSYLVYMGKHCQSIPNEKPSVTIKKKYFKVPVVREEIWWKPMRNWERFYWKCVKIANLSKM